MEVTGVLAGGVNTATRRHSWSFSHFLPQPPLGELIRVVVLFCVTGFCLPCLSAFPHVCSVTVHAGACVCTRVCFPAKGVTAGALCPPVTKRLRLLECDQPLARPPARLPTLLLLLLNPRLLGYFNLCPPPQALDCRCIWDWSAMESAQSN